MKSKKIALILTVTLLTSISMPAYLNTKADAAVITNGTVAQQIQFNLSTLEVQTNQAIANRNFDVHMNNLATWLNANVNDVTIETMQNKLNDPLFARVLAEWQFIAQTGPKAMNTFAQTEDHQKFLKWVMKDTEVMNTFLEGGKPIGDQPVKALEIWENIWRVDSSSHEGLYLKLAMATGLTHSRPVVSWTTNTTIDPIARYQHFKAADQNNELFPSFRRGDIWDLRMVVDARVTNEDLTWARKKIRETRPDLCSQQHIGESCWMPNYTDKNKYGVSIFDGGDKFYGMPFNLERVLEYGGVCGSLSTYGCSVAQAFGVPAQTIGQPGHCSFVIKKTANSWDIEYDVGGWGVAESNCERMLWADNLHNISAHEPTYLLLMEEAKSKAIELSQSERMRWLANAITSKEKATEVRNVAIKVQPLNILVWRDKIASMKSNSNVTNEQWQTLSKDIVKTFSHHLAPMMDLIYSVKDPVLKSMNEAQLQQYSLELDKVIDSVTDKKQIEIAPKVKKFKKQLGFISAEDKERIPMSIASVTSQQDPASNAIDDDISTIWHTKWDLSDKLPQSITIKIENPCDIYKLDYVPRQDDCKNGIITKYNIYTSVDGNSFTKVANGNWNLDRNKKTVEFNATNAKYVRLEALEGYGGYASAAEIIIYKKNIVQIAAADIANSITAIQSPNKGDKNLSLPQMPNGFSGRIYTSSNNNIIGTDGKINPGNTNSEVTIVLEVTRLADNTKALTKEFKVVVPADTTGDGNVVESEVYLSDLNWQSAKTDWGTINKDRSINNGPLTLDGKKYEKGMGTHASSEIVYKLDGKYSRFVSDIGVDDEVGSYGSVVFKVFGDGKLIYESNKLTGNDKTQKVDISVKGVSELKLVATNGDDGISNDHVDWANTKLISTKEEVQTEKSLLDLDWTKATIGWGNIQKNKSIDGNAITFDGKTYARGIGTHSNSEIVYNLNGEYKRFKSSVGVDAETGVNGSVSFKIYGDGRVLFDSGVIKGRDKAQNIDVDITGVNELKLVVEDGKDGSQYDHADWAEPVITK